MARYDNVSREVLKRMIGQAEAAGHVMQLEHRPDGGTAVKYWVVCSCGYRSTSRRSLSATLSTIAWHAGTMAGEASRNGAPAPAPAQPATRAPEMPPRRAAAL